MKQHGKHRKTYARGSLEWLLWQDIRAIAVFPELSTRRNSRVSRAHRHEVSLIGTSFDPAVQARRDKLADILKLLPVQAKVLELVAEMLINPTTLTAGEYAAILRDCAADLRKLVEG